MTDRVNSQTNQTPTTLNIPQDESEGIENPPNSGSDNSQVAPTEVPGGDRTPQRPTPKAG